MSQETLRMSAKERARMLILGQVESGALDLVEASKRMQVSYRQAKRLWARWLESREGGLTHRLRGQASNRQLDDAFRAVVLSLYRTLYWDFGPTLASEKMAERDGVAVHPETLRRWLHEEHLWVPRREPRRHRRRRARRSCFGELVQMDGSDHAWFEDRAGRSCLMVMVDDATGRTLGRFAAQETTAAAFEALRQWIVRYGVPQALYVDRKSLYVAQRPPTAEERRQGSGALTDFGRACFRLGIQIIPAHSPQAKGRVERRNGLLQDRLVKELRLAGIADFAQANALLGPFMERLNDRFAVPPLSPLNAHRPAPTDAVLNEILCWEWRRVLQNDWTVTLNNQRYQIERQPDLPKPRTPLTIRRCQDGTVRILHEERPLKITMIANGNQRDCYPRPCRGGGLERQAPQPLPACARGQF
jgi:transposase